MKIAISGYGAMGKLLVEAIHQEDGLELAGIVTRREVENGVPNISDLSEVPDLIIDFSHPSQLPDLLHYAASNGCKLLIATTGFSEEEMQKIENASKDTAILYAANTSLGVTLLEKLAKIAAKVLYNEDFDIEIIEKHHNKKEDAPSGTAKFLAKGIQEVLEERPALTFGRKRRQKRELNEIGIHAVRGGTITGEHTILFAGNGETIELKHCAQNKGLFVKGALTAAKFLQQHQQGFFTMNDVIQINF